MSIVALLIVVIICLFLEGFFSGSELALVVTDKLRLRNLSEKGDRKAKITSSLIEDPQRLFGTTLLGTNICTVTGSTVLTYFIISNFGVEYSIFALLYSPAVLIFGEVLPKSIYQHHADYLAKKIGSVLVWVSYIFFPIIWILSKLTQLLLGRVVSVSSSEPRISREELALMLTSKETRHSDMPPEERRMVRRILDLSDAEVENIMIPLVEIEMLPVTADMESAFKTFDLKGFSRLPVFDHRAHNIVGIVDIADCIFAEKNKLLKDVMKEVLYVPETMPLYELYETLQDEKERIAVVVDEFGGATGFVTLEDLLEEIVGDIKDEYELEEQLYKIVKDGVYVVSGRMEIEEAKEILDIDLPRGDYETIAGYLLELFNYIPENGETASDSKYDYIIRDASERAIRKIEIRKKEEETE